jgi:class 3 adenylate cyclase
VSSASSCARACTAASASCTTASSPGIAVTVGSRVAGEAGPGEVLVSSTVKDLVAGSGIEFEPLGTRALKGDPEEWTLYVVRA